MLGESAPDFSDPIGLLRACHGRILNFCDLLERMIGHQSRHGVDAELRTAAQRVLRYFDIAAPLHHQDEELDLFPPLMAVPELAPLLQRLQAQHADHDRLWQMLAAALRRIEQGDVAPDLAACVEPFAAAMREHVDIENTQVLPIAAQHLDAERLRGIGEAMAARRR